MIDQEETDTATTDTAVSGMSKTDTATIGTAVTGPLATGATARAAHIPGEDLPAKIDALHARHFAGTELTNHTPLWNKVMAFKDEVKALVEEHLRGAKAS